jgi:ribosomal protein L11
MENTLTLSKDMLGELDCTVGEEKTLSVPVKVTAYGKEGATFEVTDSPTAVEEPAADESEPVDNDGEESGEGAMPSGMADMIASRKAYA